jgi:type I site-specific restriction endonuclease
MGIKRAVAVKEATLELPGENPASNPRAVVGGNMPPPEEQVVIDFREAMIAKLPTWEQRIDDLVAAADRAVINNEDSAGKSADLIRSIRAMSNALDDAHKSAKDPYLAATRAVDGAKRQHRNRLDDAKADVERKQTEFIRQEEAKREKERREAEAAARAEAARAAAAEQARLEAEGQGDLEALEQVEAVAAPAVVSRAPEPIRSVDTGAAVSSRKVWQMQVEDYGVAVLEMLEDAKIMEAIEACAKRRMNAGLTTQPGVRCWQATVARTY